MYDMTHYLKTIDTVIEKGPYKDSWGSLATYKVPEWYKKAKFGIFIHWGLYSVPAFANEWYSRHMYIQGYNEYNHHIETYGKHKDFGYKDFISLFKAEKFNSDEWAELFSNAGAKYVVPVAEHHDGFQMYKSEISHWNAYEKGPQRDILGELK
ncbi:MAG TPA: alpha-L-fucosidase, partial [Oscillospiraceae bacterium]|nr:alpha-L-fucosidase [Oscillospiraceae bacterium]